MPKAFSLQEKSDIRDALVNAGLKRFGEQGIRATRVDDICKDVGIAKGSFYNFFPTKEDLFMTLADERDIAHKADMRAWLLETEGDAVSIAGGFFDFMMERIETDLVLKIVRDRNEIQHLLRKVSPALMAENVRRDKRFLHEIAEIFNERFALGIDGQTLQGLMSLMLSLSMQREMISITADYDGMVKLMRDLFVSRLVRGAFDDQG